MKRYTIHENGYKALDNYLENNFLEIQEMDLENAKQLDTCQAWEISGKIRTVGEINTTIENVKFLQSYQTIVAIAFDDGSFVTLGKWSRTTSAQITRWRRRLGI